jgi:hypothetical protein
MHDTELLAGLFLDVVKAITCAVGDLDGVWLGFQVRFHLHPSLLTGAGLFTPCMCPRMRMCSAAYMLTSPRYADSTTLLSSAFVTSVYTPTHPVTRLT